MATIASVVDKTTRVREHSHGYPHDAWMLDCVAVTVQLSEAEYRNLSAPGRLAAVFAGNWFPMWELDHRRRQLVVDCTPKDGGTYFANPPNDPHERAQAVLSMVNALLSPPSSPR